MTTFISIPALREEGDTGIMANLYENIISILALREEGDVYFLVWMLPVTNFYPRPPRGGRPVLQGGLNHENKFLSPPSARRATPMDALPAFVVTISIPALREEGDENKRLIEELETIFLSPPSARRATFQRRYGAVVVLFLSPPSARRATTRAAISES